MSHTVQNQTYILFVQRNLPNFELLFKCIQLTKITFKKFLFHTQKNFILRRYLIYCLSNTQNTFIPLFQCKSQRSYNFYELFCVYFIVPLSIALQNSLKHLIIPDFMKFFTIKLSGKSLKLRASSLSFKLNVKNICQISTANKSSIKFVYLSNFSQNVGLFYKYSCKPFSLLNIKLIWIKTNEQILS